MTNTVVHAPDHGHTCSPGWHLEWHESKPDGLFPMPAGNYFVQDPWPSHGTVIECECGVTWVAEYHNFRDLQGYIVKGSIDFTPQWRKERRRERRRRERKAGRR